MSANKQYQRVYLKEWEGIRAKRFALIRVAEDEFQAEKLAEQKRRQPKAKKKLKPLDDETCESIKQRLLAAYKPEIDRLEKLLSDANDRRKAKLAELGPAVQPIGDPLNWWKIETADPGSYRSQGYGANKYARGSLLPVLNALLAAGFIAEIREVTVFWQVGVSRYQFELWANCPPWMADACGNYSLLDLVTACDRNGVNPRVYNPFLPYETVEKCRKLARAQ